MVVVRLFRGGAKKKPFYKIVATDSRNRRDGRYLEQLGYFNPVARGQEVKLHIEVEKLLTWQKHGAQLSDRVAQLFKTFVKEHQINLTPEKKPVEKPAKPAAKKDAKPAAKKPAKPAAKKTAKPAAKKTAAKKEADSSTK